MNFARRVWSGFSLAARRTAKWTTAVTRGQVWILLVAVMRFGVLRGESYLARSAVEMLHSRAIGFRLELMAEDHGARTIGAQRRRHGNRSVRTSSRDMPDYG